MKIRTIALILDLPANQPYKQGSLLSYAKNVFSTSLRNMELGDRLLFYGATLQMCQTVGESVAAILNYQGHQFRFDKAVVECVDALSRSVEHDDLYLLALTNKYKDSYRETCENALKLKTSKIFLSYFWYNLDELTEDKITELLFLNKKYPLDIAPDYSPLSV